MNMKTEFKKLKCSPKLKMLSAVFDNLKFPHQKYNDYEIPDADCTFWYSERPQVGLLAAAVWRTKDAVALEEYRTSKQKTNKQKKGYGRCDLWIRLNEKLGFECEAKHGRINLGIDNNENVEKALSVLEQAICDCEKLSTKKNIHKLALGFVTLKNQEVDQKESESRRKELLKSLRLSNKCHALFWIGVPNGVSNDGEKDCGLPANHSLIFMVRKVD